MLLPLYFRMLFVKLPWRNFDSARFTFGEDGTLLGLNRSEPVSHRNRRAAPQDTEGETLRAIERDLEG